MHGISARVARGAWMSMPRTGAFRTRRMQTSASSLSGGTRIVQQARSWDRGHAASASFA